MTSYLRGNGFYINLGRELGGGGEGKIYTVVGMQHLVAKIYHQPKIEYTQKLSRMLANKPSGVVHQQGHCSIAWPVDSLFDAAGRCTGFLMPYISSPVPLLELYNPQDRLQKYPSFTWRYLLCAAKNLAIVLEELHVGSYVVGDLNESNILVSGNALVTLVDCDSIQVPKGDGQFFRCVVGKPDYTPPELQDHDFSQINRIIYHDNFGLAVLIFLMLMEGVHPFMGVWKGGGEVPKREQYIKAGNYPYTGSSLLVPPPHALTPSILPPNLQKLMTQCFVEGHLNPSRRPTAGEWRQALYDAEQHLTCCRYNNQHWYSQHLSACPWCVRKQQGLHDSFPNPAAQKKTFLW
ncbi:MAG: hypothetical protein NVSMB38_19980 [Ktedonobacteraceae bacterium]